MIRTSISKSFGKINLKKLIDKGIERMEEDLHREVQDRTPVDTGRARKGWRRTKDGTENSVPYIGALDDGHSKQAPNGITQPALNTIVRRYRSGKYFKK